MLIPRLIPCLVVEEGALIKTVRFQRRHYVGDPLNAVRIFNEKEVDELMVIDRGAARQRREPPWELLESITGECFMPLAYGGGVNSVAMMRRLYSLGIEKIVLGTAAWEVPGLVEEATAEFGSQAVVVALDVGRVHWWSRAPQVCSRGGQRGMGYDPVAAARQMVTAGAGELLIMDIERDGGFRGLNLELIRSVAEAVDVPLIGAGGVGCLADARAGLKAGASAIAVGGLVVLFGRNRAVLVNYPHRGELEREFQGLSS